MSKWSITLLFIGLSLLVVCDGSPLPHESPESDEVDVSRLSGFARRVLKECKKNTGSNDAFGAIMEAYYNSSICLSKFDGQGFMMDFDQLTNETRKAFFSKYCAEARSLLSCYDDVQTSLRPCLEEREFNMVKGLYNSFPKALDFVCKNDGDIIFKLKDATSQAGFMQMVDEMKECVYTFEDRWNYDWDVTALTQDQCSIITSYRKCLKDRLDACNLSDAISVFDIPLNAFFLHTPCVNFTEQPKVDLVDKNTADEV